MFKITAVLLSTLFIQSNYTFAEAAHCDAQLVANAEADWKLRFVPTLRSAVEPTDISMGFDVHRQGLFISCITSEGIHVQYGASLSPLEFWKLSHKGSRGKK